MKLEMMWRVRVLMALAMACLVVGFVARVKAGQAKSSDSTKVKADEIGGVVTSSKGPEAGVWVIAETTDLATKFVKIVVTDDQGRYLIPQLPKGNYKIWVRGYGLIDSSPLRTSPGRTADLKALIAPSAKAAAQYYPSDYWYSLIKVPDASEFPMKPTPALPYKGQVQATAGGLTAEQADESGFNVPKVMENQQQWITVMKHTCQGCHQLGDFATRDLTHLARYHFSSSQEAWATRIHFGQAGFTGMPRAFRDYVDQQRAIKMFADWTDRIVAGELPPAPPRPEGVERNIVISEWDWSTAGGHPHDEISTDKWNPRVNANGLVYGADYNLSVLNVLDSQNATEHNIAMPVTGDKSSMRTTWSQKLALPSPFYGEEMILGSEVGGTHSLAMDDDGRIWDTTTLRASPNPAYCKQGSDNPFAKQYPLPASGKQVALYDPETGKTTPLDTCFGTHHVNIAKGKDGKVFFDNGGNGVVGWIDPAILAKTGSIEKAQGWCAAYLDKNGDGKIDHSIANAIQIRGYGVVVSPTDGAVWVSEPGPIPGRLTRVTLGSNPPSTCSAEIYQPPYHNPNLAGVVGFTPRGIDVDSHGIIWTALSSSSQLARFDRSKCKVLTGPTATGQHCPEGWTVYTTPGPRMKGVTDDSSSDFLYYNFVDQYNALGLGENVPIVNGTNSDSLEAFLPDSKKWVVMRVPYPMGYYSRSMDGRIDDPNAGWKGRGVWSTSAPDLAWHMEGAAGQTPKVIHVQLRPNPLAD